MAAARHGDYRLTVDDYVDLAAARCWTWWTSMDYCVEPAVAGHAGIRTLRIAATVRHHHLCAESARRRVLPMPVLQCWFASEYAECAREGPRSGASSGDPP